MSLQNATSHYIKTRVATWLPEREIQRTTALQLQKSLRGNEAEEDEWPLKPQSKLGLIYAHDIP